MTAPATPTLFVIAGPNGAGKSTLYNLVLKPRLAAPFVNADDIQREELGDDRPQAAYEAAKIATDRRAALIADRATFATESVFSHPSKLELIEQAKEAGFRIALYHLSLETPDLSVARVNARMRL
ncbi:MAG: zeta toxin family protein, partial [Pseudomonadota bacterium]